MSINIVQNIGESSFLFQHQRVESISLVTRVTHTVLTLVLVFLLVPSSLYAWGREGHEIVAIIAEQRLEAHVREQTAALLEDTPFISAASWADQVRNEHTAPWHYVNIAIADTEYDAAQVCPQDQCVIAQIERFRNTLANHAASFKKRQRRSSTSFTLLATSISRFMPGITTIGAVMM